MTTEVNDIQAVESVSEREGLMHRAMEAMLGVFTPDMGNTTKAVEKAEPVAQAQTQGIPMDEASLAKIVSTTVAATVAAMRESEASNNVVKEEVSTEKVESVPAAVLGQQHNGESEREPITHRNFHQLPMKERVQYYNDPKKFASLYGDGEGGRIGRRWTR